MNVMAMRWVAIVISLMLAPCRGDSPEDYYQAARQAHERKDYAAYVSNLQQVLDAGTRHPVIYLGLAGGYAQLGNRHEALAWLDRYAALGIVAPIEEDADLQSIRSTPEFQSILRRFKNSLRPTHHSAIAFQLSEARFIPEGIAYDATTGSFFLSSILQKKVVRIDRGGEIADFIAGRDELGPVLGMNVDAGTRSLWISTSSIPEIKADTLHVSPGIFQFNLRDGSRQAGFTLTDAAPHQFGDVIAGPDGRAYTSDSASGGSVYVTGTDGRLQEFAGSGLFRSPQGLCFSKDGRTLFVADYVRGLFGIDVQSRKSYRLEPPGNVTLVGIDGLYFHDGGLLATQNGVTPQRILRVALDSKLRTVTAVIILESSHPRFREITLGVVARGALYYVANSQFGAYLEHPDAELQPPLILKLPLHVER